MLKSKSKNACQTNKNLTHSSHFFICTIVYYSFVPTSYITIQSILYFKQDKDEITEIIKDGNNKITEHKVGHLN